MGSLARSIEMSTIVHMISMRITIVDVTHLICGYVHKDVVCSVMTTVSGAPHNVIFQGCSLYFRH
jgi:hypothetical protein